MLLYFRRWPCSFSGISLSCGFFLLLGDTSYYDCFFAHVDVDVDDDDDADDVDNGAGAGVLLSPRFVANFLDDQTDAFQPFTSKPDPLPPSHPLSRTQI